MTERDKDALSLLSLAIGLGLLAILLIKIVTYTPYGTSPNFGIGS